jgi:serine/threonine-protein phosphatase 2A regulatory subunit A
VRKEDDEVLFAIAEEIGKFFSLLDNKLVLLPVLEILCCVDETVVREQAVKTLSKIADSLSGADIQNIFTPIVAK